MIRDRYLTIGEKADDRFSKLDRFIDFIKILLTVYLGGSKNIFLLLPSGNITNWPVIEQR